MSPTRDAEAAKRIFLKALRSTVGSAPQALPLEEQRARPTDPTTTRSVPRVMNAEKHAAYPKAIADLKAARILPEHVEVRQVNHLNHLIEQDHRFLKRLTQLGMGFFSIETAWRTLQGYEAMHMMRKGHMQGVKKGDGPSPATFIAMLFGASISAWQDRSVLSDDPSQIFLQHNRERLVLY